MHTSIRKRAVLTLVAPLLLLGVTACGGTDPDAAGTTANEAPSGSPSESPSTEPVDEPTEAPSDAPATSEGTEVEDAAGVFEDMQLAMREAQSARVEMDMGLGTAKGAMSYGEDTTEMALTLDMTAAGGGPVEMRYVDGAMFLSMRPLPAGKFFKIDPSNKSLGPVVGQMQGLSPEASTEMIAKSLKKMTAVGEEKIGTDVTTHYVLEVDTAESMKLLGETNLPKGAQATLPKSLEYDMWVTEDNLLRRIVMNVGSLSTQMDYTDWGKPVDIEAPGAADIVKMPKGF